jgi:small subunit ribosomal protein S2
VSENQTGIKELLEAGVHFGHQTRRWNPKMKEFIFGSRNGIHIIDLNKTHDQLKEARDFLSNLVRKGGKVLFVGTKKQAQAAIKETATATGQMHITERWLGGTLTNLKTIKRSLGRLDEIEKMEKDGSLSGYVKQEQSMIRREANRIKKNLDGVRGMEKHPDAMFIVDIKREHIAVAEGRRLKIPIVALVDTNSDPTQTQHPIPGNDDAIRSIRCILNDIAQAITPARAEFEAEKAKKAAEEAKAKAEEEAKKAAEQAEAKKKAEEAAAAQAQAADSPAPAPAPESEAGSAPAPASTEG